MSGDIFRLDGRRALVTGASSGIGRAVAIDLASRGATVMLHHFADAEGIAEVRHVVGGETPVHECDLARQGSAKTLAEWAGAEGGVDILVWNAAIERRMPWAEVDEANLAAQIAANFSALLIALQVIVPGMSARGWGRVVATGSVMAARPRAETVVYASLKAAQLTMLRAIARDVAASGVTLNVVSPGAIETEATARRYADLNFRRSVTAKIPLDRQGQPEDLIGAFAFLCSDAARYVTGVDLPVDGGWTIGDAPGALPGVGGLKEWAAAG